MSVVTSFGEISPGCGCESQVVDEIVTELKKRMRNRCDTAQIQRVELTLNRLDIVESKLVRVVTELFIYSLTTFGDSTRI